MKLVEFTVANSGSPIAVNPDTVCKVGIVNDGPGQKGTFIQQVDGSSVVVSEEYNHVKTMLRD